MINLNITIKPSFRRIGKAFGDIDFKRRLQRAITRLAYTTEREAKKVSPVDTGRMRASIATDIGNLRAVIAPHVYYAFFVHEGTRYMRARPFMKWGWEMAEKQVDINEEIKKEIEGRLRVL